MTISYHSKPSTSASTDNELLITNRDVTKSYTTPDNYLTFSGTHDMAQPVFDEHPLEQYLKRASCYLLTIELTTTTNENGLVVFGCTETGEGVERMPGTMLDLPSPYPEDDDDELDSQSSETDDKLFGLAQLLPPGMIRFVEVSFVRLVAYSLRYHDVCAAYRILPHV